MTLSKHVLSGQFWCRGGLLCGVIVDVGGQGGAGSVEDVEPEVAPSFDPFVVLFS
jgi:hypothetical protein